MLKSVLLDKFKIKQDSIFDLEELYKQLFRWFENNGYSFYEKVYQDQDTPGGKIILISWTAERKIDTYLKFVIDISYTVTGLSKIELERSGAKISTNKGKVEFEITAYLSKDYDNKWSNTPFMKNARRIYDSYIIRDRIERLEGELVNEYQALIDEIRSFLVLHKF